MINTMNVKVRLVLLFVVLALVAAIAVSTVTMSSAQNNTMQPVVSVDLLEKSLAPNSVTLRVGESIRINNKSNEQRELFLGSGHDGHGEQHAMDDGHGHDHNSSFSTGLIGTDEAWEGFFSEPGTYFLHDHDRPEANLLIVVYR